MSRINPEVTNGSVIPQVESSFFLNRPESRFAIGVLAVDSSIIPGRQNEYEAYLQLRRRVYVEQTGYLSPEDIQPDGTDRDEDDTRSIAFAVVENRGIDQRLVATARLIRKDLGVSIGADPRPLPVEQEWPEAFTDLPSEPKSAEVSRLISRYEKPAIQEINKRKLYAELLAYARANGIVSALTVMETQLLAASGVIHGPPAYRPSQRLTLTSRPSLAASPRRKPIAIRPTQAPRETAGRAGWNRRQH